VFGLQRIIEYLRTPDLFHRLPHKREPRFYIVMHQLSEMFEFSGERYPESATEFLNHFYIPDMTRVRAESILTCYTNTDANEKDKGVFMLRDANRAPLGTPVDQPLHYCVSYWNYGESRFNHLFLCCGDVSSSWTVLETEITYKSYPTLIEILLSLPPLKNSQLRCGLIVRKDCSVV
jgi:hypothetical protein